MNENKYIAIYCRVSTDEQAEHGYNLREQERRILQYIDVYEEEFNLPIKKYIDDGYTGRNLKRKMIPELISDIKSGMITKLIIHNLDRLTRNINDLTYLLELLNKYDVQLFSLKEKIDTKTATGRFFVSMIILVAQWETETISERTIRGIDQSALEGNYTHGRAPFGYTLVNKKLVIKPLEAAIVEQVFDMYYYEEMTLYSIYHFMANHYDIFDFKWTYERIKIMLNNPIYKGTFKNPRLTIPDHSPAIVSKELFDNVQEQIKSRARNGVKGIHHIFGRKVHNIQSGEGLIYDSTKKPNKRYMYYYDPAVNIRINEKVLDDQIAPLINNHFNKITKEIIRKKIVSLKKLDSNISVLDHLYVNGVIDKAYYRKVTKEITDSIRPKEKVVYDLSKNTLKWEDMEVLEKVRVIKSHVDKIFVDVYTKKIIQVNFKEIF